MRSGFFLPFCRCAFLLGRGGVFCNIPARGGGIVFVAKIGVLFNKIGVLWLLQACFCKWQLFMFATSVFPTPCVGFLQFWGELCFVANVFRKSIALQFVVSSKQWCKHAQPCFSLVVRFLLQTFWQVNFFQRQKFGKNSLQKAWENGKKAVRKY